MSSPTSTAPPAATTSSGNDGGGSSGGPTSSPLLFFVALGFGVVFTNLWIIVGVKYCFRYNQRNRQIRNDENGEPIDLANMPRAHRRRREKKLMTMEEVNERFPLTKYKAWRAARAAEGLPTAGGVAATTASRAPSIRAPSIKDEAVTQEEEQRPKSQQGQEQAKSSSQAAEQAHASSEKQSKENDESKPTPAEGLRPGTAQTHNPPETPVSKVVSTDPDLDDDDEHDDQIQTALPAEMLADPGDSCAICIDNIEDDDDIRGLTCGHAFHAHCVDPWLTSRRASCPLCKADYYIPKPRPEGADATAESERISRRTRGANMPASPPYALMGHRHGGRPRMILPGRFMTIVAAPHDRYGFPQVQRESRPDRENRQRNGFFNFRNNRQRAPTTPVSPASRNGNTGGNVSSNDSANNNGNTNGAIGSRLRNIRMAQPSMPNTGFLNRFRRGNPAASDTATANSPEISGAGGTSNTDPTPSQLEAGHHSTNTQT
ncbi:MAG: hypothetical protein Q9227_005370 [Pyrenula ochraceoflavens]